MTPERQCRVCGASIEHRQKTARYCSENCKSASARIDPVRAVARRQTDLRSRAKHLVKALARKRAYDEAIRTNPDSPQAQRVRARRTFQYAVRHGHLVRPDSCEECGSKCRPHGHHDDYSQPLHVAWLCTICHGKRHRSVRAALARIDGDGAEGFPPKQEDCPAEFLAVANTLEPLTSEGAGTEGEEG